MVAAQPAANSLHKINLNRLSFRVIIIEQQAIAPRVKERGVYRIILQKILLTTQQTTYRSGALGNSGDKSTEEYRFPSGKGRKKPFSAESAIINAFGTIRPQVRSLSLGPNLAGLTAKSKPQG